VFEAFAGPAAALGNKQDGSKGGAALTVAAGSLKALIVKSHTLHVLPSEFHGATLSRARSKSHRDGDAKLPAAFRQPQDAAPAACRRTAMPVFSTRARV